MTVGPNRRTPSPEPQAGAFVVPASLQPGGVLTPDDLALAGAQLFGRWGWQTRLAEALEVDGSTVRRWVSGAVTVPQPAKVAIRLMLAARGAEALLSGQDYHSVRPRPSRRRTTSLATEKTGQAS